MGLDTHARGCRENGATFNPSLDEPWSLALAPKPIALSNIKLSSAANRPLKFTKKTKNTYDQQPW